MKDPKGRINPRYIGVDTQLERTVEIVFALLADDMENRSRARLYRILIWAGLAALGARIPDYEWSVIERLKERLRDTRR